ncbi:hypothetical protein C723_1951 [Christiangramia flava JLT2011]|uniref:Uncharacterized protein n=1 Tax=Christiangramia flava JLT2011 TaxID=1229726 RepID=A0A1L7I5L6_9FLAO|nr:hypothetical protein GRFL_2185 [Christiangramia flava JLT2011]OSS38945.1 hypothetical protein C723_1951 [Christiangramia flava JLT2011]
MRFLAIELLISSKSYLENILEIKNEFYLLNILKNRKLALPGLNFRVSDSAVSPI